VRIFVKGLVTKTYVMKTGKKYHTHFVKSSTRSAEEIKAACEQIKSGQKGYDIRSNGNHIWIEVARKRQQYWSPMLHLHLRNSDDKTFIKGEFAENPTLWLAFVITQIISIVVFVIALVVAYFKYRADWNFNPELFLMFAMVTVWFTLHLISERYKRKGARQIQELHNFVDAIATA
jgi:hypothetical protein